MVSRFTDCPEINLPKMVLAGLNWLKLDYQPVQAGAHLIWLS